MTNNNRRSTPVINDHLPIEEVSEKVQFRSQKLDKMAAINSESNVMINFFIWGVTYLLKNRSYMFKRMHETDLRLLLIIRRVTVK
jgi:hypothetical protein